MAGKSFIKLMHMGALGVSKDYLAAMQGRILDTLFHWVDECVCIESIRCRD